MRIRHFALITGLFAMATVAACGGGSSPGHGPVAGFRAGARHCAAGRTFYISYASGSDSSSGTSEASAWKRVPGMRGFTGSYAHQPGDCFIFQGGVTWPGSVFPLVATGSGTAGRDDYYGVNATWYSGPGFTQPVFDAGGATIPGPLDSFISLAHRDHIEVDDLAFRNWSATKLTTGFGSCAMIDANSAGGSGDQGIVIDAITVSGFKVDATGDSEHADCSLVGAYTGSPWAGNSIVENSTFTGSGDTYGRAVYCFGNAVNNTISGMVGGVYPCGHGTISGNSVSDCGYPSFPPGATGVHADAIESLGSDGAFYLYDNVVHDTGADSRGNECEAMFLGNAGEIDYVWNNLLYNLHGDSPALTQGSTVGRSAYFWNNTIVGGFGATQACLRQGHGDPPVTVWENNLCISSDGHSVAPAASTSVQGHNVLLTPAVAERDGYAGAASSRPYHPPGGASPTSGAGANLSSQCSGPLADLCSVTSLAGRLVPGARSASGRWNVGAY